MTLDDELDRLLSYHISSPQFVYYEGLFRKRLDSDLYNTIINVDRYKSLTDKLTAYLSTFSTFNEIGILDVLDACRRSIHENYILESCSAPMVKYIKTISEDIYRIIDESKDVRFEVNTRLSYLIDLLTSANSVIKDSDRKVYYYLEKCRACMIVTHRVHAISSELNSCYYIYFQLYRQVIEDDKDFYNYLYNSEYNPNVQLEQTNIFNSRDDMSYYDFLILRNDFFRNLMLPSTQNDTLTKDYVLNLILDSGTSYKAKEFYSTCINDLFDKLYYFKSTPYDGLSAYNSFGEEFIYYLDYKSSKETKDFCSVVISMCQPIELIKFCVYKADNSYLENNNSLFCYNQTLYNTLLSLQEVGLIDKMDELYEYFKRSE